tara:strand:+ start:636 stop:854 length:219 start_codon:yes stop_codon:yes gene_type:complete
MNIPDFTVLRNSLQAEIDSLQSGETSINQAKVMSNLANGIINSWMTEILATKALPDNSNKALEHDYIDVRAD